MSDTTLISHLTRQSAFSRGAFGPGLRTAGVLDHLEKEIEEVRESGGSLAEWIDLVILSLDGALRAAAYADGDHGQFVKSAAQAAETVTLALEGKQGRNETRIWPDWRTAPADKAIEHVRGIND